MNSESKTIRKNFDAVMASIIKAGLQIEPKFTFVKEGDNPRQEIDEQLMEHYFQLAMYFDKSPECKLDLNKGIMLTGSVGTGKTLLFKIMQRLFRTPKIIACRHIIREYLNAENKSGKVIDDYGRFSFKPKNGGGYDYEKPIHVCFDDLGLEEVDTKMYGNKANVMAEILLDRYEHFKTYKMLTHATTNLGASALETNYGVRGRDRLREMMNVIEVTGNSKRK